MFIVDTPEKLAEALEFINGQEILAFDTETDSLNVRRGNIIGFGVAGPVDGFYVPRLAWNSNLGSLVPVGLTDSNIRLILEALKKKKLLMFNASFDARFTRNNLGVDLLPSLHADVLLLKHTCDEEFPLDLKGIAKKLWGASATEEKEELKASIKENDGKATEYYKANLDVIAKYCIKDCILTYRMYAHYSRDLKRQGLEKFYYEDEVLPLYKEVTIPMEDAGVRLDMPKLQQSLHEIKQDLAKIEADIQAAIAPNLGLFTEWFLNKDYPPKTYTGKPSVWTKKHKTQYDAWRADNPTGYMFNLESVHHLKKLFFDTLNETPVSRTPKGSPQVDDEFLHQMAAKYPWAAQLIEYRKLTKIKGTYIERFLEESEDGRFYPSFQQHRTVSGRYAGDLQQLPRPLDPGAASEVVTKYTNRIREFIISDPGYRLISADYEQLEPSIFAHTSGDKALQEIFKNGTDFYSTVAIRTERLTGVSADKQAPNYLGKINKAARQKAKAYALGIAYGMTGYKLQFEIGVSNEEADLLVQNYLAAFPSLARWMQTSKDAANFDGYVKTQAGRIRHLPRAKQIFQQFGARITDSLHLYKAYSANPAIYQEVKSVRKEYINLLNNAINFQVQGLAASIVNRAAILLARQFKAAGLSTRIVGQVHDELVFSAPESELEQVCPIIKHTMETVVKLDVPLRTVPQVGTNYRECK